MGRFLGRPLLAEHDSPPHSLRARILQVYPPCYSSRTAARLAVSWEIPLIVTVVAEACGSALHRADSGNILYTMHVILCMYEHMHARAQALLDVLV